MNEGVVIVGGGILGLATALRILQDKPGTPLVLVEKESGLAQHQTGHNSGVIHAGLYYKPGSLKAINCRQGYQQLVDFCRAEEIEHDICGKIVVATEEREIPLLEELHRRGTANGLDGIRVLQPEEIREIEPHCRGVRGLFVPQTGIVDYKVVSRKYADRIKAMGGEIVLGETVTDIKRRGEKVEVIGRSRNWTARAAVVCAGLHSDRLARSTEPDLPLRILPFRGEYFQLKPSAQYLVKHLIYPVPNPDFPFLGVHFTRMAGGGIECGPNAVFAWGREAYRKTDFNLRDAWEALTWPGFHKVAGKYWRNGLGEYYRSFSKQAFVKALQKLIPEIQPDHLEPGGAGIRAQACHRDGRLLDDFDFRVDGNIVHVCNAPSPAATSSLAIGHSIAHRILPILN
jgi:L-2-hydroxyglutarate oxidase